MNKIDNHLPIHKVQDMKRIIYKSFGANKRDFNQTNEQNSTDELENVIKKFKRL